VAPAGAGADCTLLLFRYCFTCPKFGADSTTPLAHRAQNNSSGIYEPVACYALPNSEVSGGIMRTLLVLIVSALIVVVLLSADIPSV
jgi:hypothetical protein